MRQGVVYARASSKEQEKEGFSVLAQSSSCYESTHCVTASGSSRSMWTWRRPSRPAVPASAR